MGLYNNPVYRAGRTKVFVAFTSNKRQFTALQTTIYVEINTEDEDAQVRAVGDTRRSSGKQDTEAEALRRERRKGNCLIIPIPQNKSRQNDKGEYIAWNEEDEEGVEQFGREDGEGTNIIRVYDLRESYPDLLDVCDKCYRWDLENEIEAEECPAPSKGDRRRRDGGENKRHRRRRSDDDELDNSVRKAVKQWLIADELQKKRERMEEDEKRFLRREGFDNEKMEVKELPEGDSVFIAKSFEELCDVLSFSYHKGKRESLAVEEGRPKKGQVGIQSLEEYYQEKRKKDQDKLSDDKYWERHQNKEGGEEEEDEQEVLPSSEEEEEATTKTEEDEEGEEESEETETEYEKGKGEKEAGKAASKLPQQQQQDEEKIRRFGGKVGLSMETRRVLQERYSKGFSFIVCILQEGEDPLLPQEDEDEGRDVAVEKGDHNNNNEEVNQHLAAHLLDNLEPPEGHADSPSSASSSGVKEGGERIFFMNYC